MSESYEERHGTEPTGDTGCEGLVPDPEPGQVARHVEIKIDGLPGQLPSGHYAMTFSGMEYLAGSNRPVVRFRYAGHLADDARIMHQIEQIRRSPAEQAEAEGWLLPPAGLPEVYRTRSGKIITEAMIEAWAAEAEAGYDLTQFEPPQPQRQGLWPRREEEANQWPRDHTSPPQPPQQYPDLYMAHAPGVELLNVSKLARVITALIHKGVLDPAEIGLVPDEESHLTPGIEDWLRS